MKNVTFFDIRENQKDYVKEEDIQTYNEIAFFNSALSKEYSYNTLNYTSCVKINLVTLSREKTIM